MLIPKVVNSIVCTPNVKIDNGMETACYKIDFNNGIRRDVFVNISKYHSPCKLDKINIDFDEFINGYKIVKLVNGYYSYVREFDNKLMPYEYDIAFNFNEYGLAMVGKAGTVSWINKDFKYLDSKGNMVNETSDSWKNFDGWQGIYNFNENSNPLSRLFLGKEDYGRTVYVDKEGNIKSFYQYDGDISKNRPQKEFFTGTDFNEKNYAFADDYILYSNGFCISKNDIIKLCLEDGFIDFLFEDAEFKFNKIESEKALIKKI